MPAYPGLKIENSHAAPVAGIDEVGVACLAGPVVAAAIVFPPLERRPRRLKGLTDSKLMTAEARERLDREIRGMAQIGLGAASAREIDRINIFQARMLAMRRALAALPVAPETVLVDGNQAPSFGCRVETLVKGETKSLSIAAASVVAKVARDRLMHELSRRYPGFGWQTNVGYGTDAHYVGLMRCGLTPHHRRSFEPIKSVFSDRERWARWRFDPWCGPAPSRLIAFELRRDLHAVFAETDQHVGLVKWVRGRWVFQAVGYDEAGQPVPAAGPLSPCHAATVAAPVADRICDLLAAMAAPPGTDPRG